MSQKTTKLPAAGLLALALTSSPVLANPATVPISKAFGETQRLKVSGETDHYLDFTNTGYRVLKAYPSQPGQFRALFLSSTDNQQLVLRWVKNSTAKTASVAIKMTGPGGAKTLTLLVSRSKKVPENILTAYTPPVVDTPSIPPEAVTTRDRTARLELIRPKWDGPGDETKTVLVPAPPTRAKRPQSIAIAPNPQAAPPRILNFKVSPKPVQGVARVSTSGKVLRDRSELNNRQLAHYLLKGLHNARGEQHINRFHPNYWLAQSMAIRLKKGDPIPKALRISGLSRKTFDDLLGYARVGK